MVNNWEAGSEGHAREFGHRLICFGCCWHGK